MVRPDFALPTGWKVRAEPVVVVTPDGQSREMTAHLVASHFSIPDPAKADQRWRLVMSFPGEGKEAVPLGSKVLVSHSLRAAINQDQIAN